MILNLFVLYFNLSSLNVFILNVSFINKTPYQFCIGKESLPYPDFLEVQLKSFQDFLQLDTPPEKRNNEGLYKVFAENFPIVDTRNNYVLEFLDYYIDPRATQSRSVLNEDSPTVYPSRLN